MCGIRQARAEHKSKIRAGRLAVDIKILGDLLQIFCNVSTLDLKHTVPEGFSGLNPSAPQRSTALPLQHPLPPTRPHPHASHIAAQHLHLGRPRARRLVAALGIGAPAAPARPETAAIGLGRASTRGAKLSVPTPMSQWKPLSAGSSAQLAIARA